MHIQSLFHINSQPTQSLVNVFKYLNVAISTLEEANSFAQNNFLRVGEFWDVQNETNLHVLMRKNERILFQELKQLGLIDKIYPTQFAYDYVLFMGSLKEEVEIRLEFLKELILSNYQFKQIVLLGGERSLLDSEKESLPNNISTETEMVIYLFKLAFKDQDVLIINVPRIKLANGLLKRPTTDDTLKYFNELSLTGGSCLVVSNNPYISRQTQVARRILDQNKFPTQGTGPECNEGYLDIIMLMDAFSRTLYEEYCTFYSAMSK